MAPKKSKNIIHHLRDRELGKTNLLPATANQLQEQPASTMNNSQPPPLPPQQPEHATLRAGMRRPSLNLFDFGENENENVNVDTVTSRAFLRGLAPADTVTSHAAALHGNGVEQDEINHNQVG
tara:strand:- start:626 stop:994 length:369 start_codon:yes stop_codon:yes gene_type:complete